MKRQELLNSKEYWLTKIQLDLFNEVDNYMERNKLKRKDLAEKFGVSKGYISQVLNGEADHRLSKLVEIALGIGVAPVLTFQNLQEVTKADVIKSILNIKANAPDQNHLTLLKSLQSKDKQTLDEIYSFECRCNETENCFEEACAS